jgi:hypothetical protein
MPSPIFSTKRLDRKIGYIEGDQALDLFDRPRATYESHTGLLRHPNTRAVLGYIALNGSFVGSSQTAKELFSEADSVPVRDAESNAGAVGLAASSGESAAERLDRSASDIGKREAELTFPVDHLDLAAGTRGPAIFQQILPDPVNNHAISALEQSASVAAFNLKSDDDDDDDVRPARSAQQFEGDGGTGADENSAPDQATPSFDGPLAADSRSKHEGAPAPSRSSQIEREPRHGPSSGIERCSEPASEPEPLNKPHGHCEPNTLVHLEPPQVEAASMAVSVSSEVSVPETHEADAERQEGDADPTDRDALGAVDTFMLHPAEYLDTYLPKHEGLRDQPYIDSLAKRAPLGRPPQGDATVSSCDTQNAVAQDQSIPAPRSGPSGVEDRKSSLNKPGGNDDVEEAPEELSDPAQSNETASPALSSKETARAVDMFATSGADIYARSSDGERYAYGPQSAPNENRPSTDSQGQQPASDLPKRQIGLDFQPTLDALERAIELASSQSLEEEAEPPYRSSVQNDEPLRQRFFSGNEAPLQGEHSLQGALDTQVAPTATVNVSLADAEPSETAVSKPHTSDMERAKADAGANDSDALRAVDTFMVHLAAYLEARHGSAETDIDSSLDQCGAAPSLEPDTPNASDHEALRDNLYSDSPSLVGQGDTFANSPQKSSHDNAQNRSVRDESLPTTTFDADTVKDRQTSQIEPRVDSYVRGANDNTEDVSLIDQIIGPALSTENTVVLPKFLEDHNSDSTGDDSLSGGLDSIVAVVDDKFGNQQYAALRTTDQDARKQMENVLGTVLVELEKK